MYPRASGSLERPPNPLPYRTNPPLKISVYGPVEYMDLNFWLGGSGGSRFIESGYTLDRYRDQQSGQTLVLLIN